MGLKARAVIALTGNIACGKSTVARMLGELGVPVIDADQVSREVTSKGSPLLARLAQELGAELIDQQGNLDRKLLRERVFSDEGRRRRLEAILHPAIRARSLELFEERFHQGHQVVIYEASLIFEAGRASEFDGILLVTCPPSAQRARLVSRDDTIPAELAERMMAAQLPQAEKARLATWVLENDGTVDELRAKVRAWHAQVIRQ